MANIFTTKVKQISKEWILNATGEFDSILQETDVVKLAAAQSVKNLNWAVNSSGYIKLSWVGSGANPDDVFAILSGNGRWELGSRGSFAKPTTSTGEISVTTVGFIATDTYTIVLLGNS